MPAAPRAAMRRRGKPARTWASGTGLGRGRWREWWAPRPRGPHSPGRGLARPEAARTAGDRAAGAPPPTRSVARPGSARPPAPAAGGRAPRSGLRLRQEAGHPSSAPSSTLLTMQNSTSLPPAKPSPSGAPSLSAAPSSPARSDSAAPDPPVALLPALPINAHPQPRLPPEERAARLAELDASRARLAAVRPAEPYEVAGRPGLLWEIRDYSAPYGVVRERGEDERMGDGARRRRRRRRRRRGRPRPPSSLLPL